MKLITRCPCSSANAIRLANRARRFANRPHLSPTISSFPSPNWPALWARKGVAVVDVQGRGTSRGLGKRPHSGCKAEYHACHRCGVLASLVISSASLRSTSRPAFAQYRRPRATRSAPWNMPAICSLERIACRCRRSKPHDQEAPINVGIDDNGHRRELEACRTVSRFPGRSWCSTPGRTLCPNSLSGACSPVLRARSKTFVS